jgi:IS30 family transposase
MGKQYRHLCAEERAVLQIERDGGTDLRAIARRLGCKASTLSREIKHLDTAVYSAHAAGKR